MWVIHQCGRGSALGINRRPLAAEQPRDELHHCRYQHVNAILGLRLRNVRARFLKYQGETVMRRWSIIPLLFVATPALAAPTYLSCSISNSNAPATVLTIAADEDTQTVTYTVASSGASFRRPAVFSPTSVEWNDDMRYAALRYSLSRTTLQIRRSLQIGDNPGRVESGTCTVQRAPTRAF
jgi:hypothetical protein